VKLSKSKCHQKREGPHNNQTPLALLVSDRASIRYLHIKRTAQQHHWSISTREIHHWSTTDSPEPLQTQLLLRTSKIKMHNSDCTKRSSLTQASTFPERWTMIWQLFCLRSSSPQKQTTWTIYPMHFPNFSVLRPRSLFTIRLSPNSGASHPLVTNVAEEISN
jgi:hypothetical protein